MKPLTQRQQQVLTFIQDRVKNLGIPPTRAEIARALGFNSVNAAEEHVRALVRKGVIDTIPGTSRGIRILIKDEPLSSEGIPLVGEVAAGAPILSQQHIEKIYQVDADMFQPKANFFLKVKGLSMKKIGIMEGDLLAVHKTSEVKNGQVIVARLGDEVTVKRFEKKGSEIFLHPENPDFSPIIVTQSDNNFAIEGVAVGVIRADSFM
jgi:repressor LexA